MNLTGLKFSHATDTELPKGMVFSSDIGEMRLPIIRDHLSDVL